MFKEVEGNIFNSNKQVIVNTVNCVGVMGKGIALECKLRYPEMFKAYKKYCDQKNYFQEHCSCGKIQIHGY